MGDLRAAPGASYSAGVVDGRNIPAPGPGTPGDGRAAAGAGGAAPGAGRAAPGAGGAAPGWRGSRLGLPTDGPGSLASAGQRFAGFAADVLLSALVAGLFTAPALPRDWSLVAFAAEYLVFTVAFGQTAGMRLVGLRVIRLDRPARLDPLRAALRTLLLVLLVPVLIWDADGRCLHDRFSQTAVVRT
jgi:hypothetical protein